MYPLFATSSLGAGHGLLLHGVHARQAAYSLLIKFHHRPGLGQPRRTVAQLCQFIFQAQPAPLREFLFHGFIMPCKAQGFTNIVLAWPAR